MVRAGKKERRSSNDLLPPPLLHRPLQMISNVGGDDGREGKAHYALHTAHEVNKAYEYVRTAEVISRCKRQDIPISGILKVRNHLQCGRARHRILGDRLPRTEGFVECFF